ITRLERLTSDAHEIASPSLDNPALRDRLEQFRAKLLVPDSVHEDGFVSARKTREDRLRRALENSPRSVPGCNLYGKGIRFRRSIEIAHLNKPKSSSISVRGDGRLLDHLKMAQGPRLGTKPAAVLDVIGKDFLLELFALAIVKQRMQFCMRMDRRHQALLCRPAAFSRRLQRAA